MVLARGRAAVAAVLGWGAAVRGGRVFHPKGRASRGSVLVTGGAAWGARLLDEAGRHDVVVRVSRGVGLPERLPDLGGLAIRFAGRGVDGQPLDLLLSSAGGCPVLRHVILPEPVARTYSSIVPYRTASGRRLVLGARRQPDGRWELLVARLLGGWRRWGWLSVGSALPPAAAERLGFLPASGAPDLVPVAFLRALRARSYRASQATRQAVPPTGG